MGICVCQPRVAALLAVTGYPPGMRVPTKVLGLWLTVLGVGAQENADRASAITEAWRGMDRVFDLVLPPSDGEAAYDRTVFLLVDASPALAKSGFVEAFTKALDKHATALAKTKFGVARVGLERPPAAPTDDRPLVTTLLKQAFDAPADKILNVLADVRTVANALRGRPGSKVILVATLDNGDAEDDLDGTVALLDSLQIRAHVLTTEAYVADSYWTARSYERDKAPRGAKLVGGDAPHIDMPWGWVFQITVANEVTPSGYGPYLFNRLAAGTGGKVFLHAGADAGEHRCSIHGICLFCAHDHIADREIYWTNRIQPLSASTKTRAAAAAELGADPVFRATANAWKAAASAGLLRSQPPRLGNTVGSSAPPGADRFGGFAGTAFDRFAERADASAKECDRIRAAFEAELSHLDATKGTPRSRAIAEFTRIMLQLTNVNFVTFAGWCREIAPGLVAKDPPAPAPPEILTIDRDERAVGIGYTNLSLCHGARPFLEVDLPGGAKLREELVELDAMITKFAASHEQTPFLVALNRQAIARFHLTYPGVATKIDRERPKSKKAPDPTTQTGGNRPSRGGATGTGGGSTGPTTGGGK